MNKQQLFENIKRKKSFLCVGLDTDIKKIPEHLLKEEDPIFAFNKAIIDATADLCIAYKPNLAFYESMGVKGWIAFEKTVNYIKQNYPDLNSSQARPKRENIMCKSIRFSTFNFYIDSIYRAFLYQHLIFNSSNIARIFSKVVIRVGTKGRRSLFSINPITFSIAFTPAGLPSTNSKLNNSVNL